MTERTDTASREERAISPVESFAQAATRLRAQRPLRNRRLQKIVADLRGDRAEMAETALEAYLASHADDPDALMLMAQVALGSGRTEEGVALLERCLVNAPDFARARFEYAKLLALSHEFRRAFAEIQELMRRDADNPHFRQLKATILSSIGEDEEALGILHALAGENPDRAESWIRYGDALRVTGSYRESVAAYRNAVRCRPSSGSAWWSLANLKIFRFDRTDIDAIEEQLRRSDLASEDRVNLLFALGKAYEDQGRYERSFECYAKGNASRRLAVDHDAGSLSSHVREQKALFTASFFQNRSGSGSSATGPIFIVGRPRSGSTLIEQILASHPAIEGTAELPYLADFVRRLAEHEARTLNVNYPEVLAKLEPSALTALGQEYLERTRIHRKTDCPFFIDKAPANYHHVAMIQLILPGAKIIDARRHPGASCFSMFKHNYTDTNLRLTELGRVYRDYVALMAHFDRALPGRIHRVIHEVLIADPEAEVRQLLKHLGLPFDERCLTFYASKRTVRSPSSEQVRRPISAEAVDQWRHFDAWLGPLKGSLGNVLTAYPAVPEELTL